MFSEDLYTDQLAAVCEQFVRNKLLVEDIIRRGQQRMLRNHCEDPGWYRSGLRYENFSLLQSFEFSTFAAALTPEELTILGCKPSQMSNLRYSDGSVPVFYFCSDLTTVSEIIFPNLRVPGPSDWYFRCGRSDKSRPAYAPFCFSGLRALPFVENVDLRIYSTVVEFGAGLIYFNQAMIPLIAGEGRSMEQTYTPMRELQAHAYAGTTSGIPILQLASFFPKLNVYGLDCTRDESTDSILSSVRAEYFAGMLLRQECERSYAAGTRMMEEFAAINFGEERVKYIVGMLGLSVEEGEGLVRKLCRGSSSTSEAVALDSKHTLAADPYTSTIIDATGLTHMVYNYKVRVLGAVLFGEGGVANYFQLRVALLDKNGFSKEVDILAGRRALTSWKEMSSCLKHACERDGIEFEPVAEDTTYGTLIQKHWIDASERAPFLRGNTFLGFSPVPGGGYVMPSLTLLPGKNLYTNWLPHPADPGMSHYSPLTTNRGINLDLVSRPGFRTLLGYCVAAAARYMLGQELRPLVFRDSAEARFICTNFFQAFGQAGPLFIRQTDGAGVYKKIFSTLMGYPLWCLGPYKPVVKPMRGPVIVLDSEAEQELAPDPVMLEADVAPTAFALFNHWMLTFLMSPESALIHFSTKDPCTSGEGTSLLASVQPTAGWQDFNDAFPLLREVLLDIPAEAFEDMLEPHKKGTIFTPFKWPVQRGYVKKELESNGIPAHFHGTNSLWLPEQASVALQCLAEHFYQDQKSVG